jgi:peptidyl-prolyl cis-trans isomerase SurA
MSIRLFLLFFCILFSSIALSQTKDVLFTINNTRFYKEEFVRDMVAEKGENWNKPKDSIQKFLEQYVDLKLKIMGATTMEIAQSEKYTSEVHAYEKNILKNYLYDHETLDILINETYHRLQSEIHIKHILIRIDPNASPKDSLLAYQKALNIRGLLSKGSDFEELARQYSEDPTAVLNGGNLGYVKPCQIPYEIENYIYGKQQQEYSLPIRTLQGYHIVKYVNKRPNPGRFKIAHILIANPKPGNELLELKTRQKADSIYLLAKAGYDFAELSRDYSSDLGSALSGGELPWFTTGEMPFEFESSAFALKADGEISKPIQTSYGWHIIKRISQINPEPIEKIKDQIANVVITCPKGKIAEAKKLEHLKMKYRFKDHGTVSIIGSMVDSSIFEGKWQVPAEADLNSPLFSVDKKSYLASDFARYILNNQQYRLPIPIPNYINSLYQDFIASVIFEIEIHDVRQNNLEFAQKMKAFREKMLYYQALDLIVDQRVKDDTTGLKDYYQKHLDLYNTALCADICIYSYSTTKTSKLEKEFIRLKEMNLSDTLIESRIQSTIDVGFIFSRCTKNEEGADKITDICIQLYKEGKLIKGQRLIWLHEQKYLVWLNSEIQKAIKPIESIKEKLLEGYRQYLLKNWVQELRRSNTIVINESVLNTL